MLQSITAKREIYRFDSRQTSHNYKEKRQWQLI